MDSYAIMSFIGSIISSILSRISTIIGPLIGAFFGVLFGFWINDRHNKKLRGKRKLFFSNLLMHEAKKSIELIGGNVNLIPIDAWNAIVNSGDIALFEDKAIELSDIYFQIQNYNYEAKIIREAYEFSNLVIADPNTGEAIPHGSFLRKKFDENTKPALLKKLIELEKWVRPLAGTISTSVTVKGTLNVIGGDEKEKIKKWWQFWK